MEPIQFLQYERMSDDLYYLGKNVVLRFNLGLASYKDGKRYFFHKEYDYEKNGNRVVTIKRTYDYYLSLENISDNGSGKEFIIIGVKDFLRFKASIETCITWFTDKKFKNLFVQNKNNLILTSPIPTCELNGLPSGKYIKYDPVVIEYGQTIDDKQPGVAVTLSNPNNFVEMNVDTLMGLYYIIKDFNMLLMAQGMLAYLAPPANCNRYSVGDGTQVNYYKNIRIKQLDQNREKVSGIEGRRVKKPEKNNLEALD